MSVLAELEALQQKRQAHVEAIAKIDEELDRARIALGINKPLARPLTTAERHGPGFRIKQSSSAAQRIFDVLEAQEPLTLRQITEATALSYSSVSIVVSSLRKQEKLVATKVCAGGATGRSVLLVARTRDKLPAPESADELGPSSATKDAAGSGADPATSPAAAPTSDAVTLSESMSVTHG